MISMNVKRKRKRNQLRKKAATVKCAGKVIAEAKVIVAIK
jgi:3-hydroxymyristoyl/3-hydroxydecanoyl-(acyl carrier protein) dehydratase